MRAIVVGGGIFGASAAYHLASAGAEAILIERAHEGRATSAGAGIICPWGGRGTDPDYYEISRRGAVYYPELVAALAELGETDLSYKRVGCLSAWGDAEVLDAQEKNVRARAALSPEAGVISRLTPKEAKPLFPPMRDDWGAVHIAGGARMDGRKMSAGLTRAAVKKGARLITGEVALRHRDSRVLGVSLGNEDIDADEVIVCAGAWGRTLLAPLGYDLPVVPWRGQIIHLGLPGVATADWAVYSPLAEHYLLAFDDSRVVVGATWDYGSGFDYRMTAGGVQQVLKDALFAAPGLADATLIETRIGFRPLSADRRPVIGRVPGIDGLVIGNGLGSNGLTMGPLGGRIVAEIAQGLRPDFDLRPYDPMRF